MTSSYSYEILGYHSGVDVNIGLVDLCVLVENTASSCRDGVTLGCE